MFGRAVGVLQVYLHAQRRRYKSRDAQVELPYGRRRGCGLRALRKLQSPVNSFRTRIDSKERQLYQCKPSTAEDKRVEGVQYRSEGVSVGDVDPVQS